MTRCPLSSPGLLDFANVGRIALETNMLEFDLGAMWMALHWFVPAVLVAHIAIIDRLLAARRGADASMTVGGCRDLARCTFPVFSPRDPPPARPLR